METFFEGDAILSAKKEEQNRISEEVNKLSEERERISGELLSLNDEYADRKSKLQEISQGIDNAEFLQILEQEKIQAEKELSDIRESIRKERRLLRNFLQR